MRKDYFEQQKNKVFVPLAQIRSRKLSVSWDTEPITKPSFLGVKHLDDYDLSCLREYISWDPFF